MWLRIRKDKKGESTEDVASIKEKIVDYKQKVAEGTLVVEGSKDVLTLALGTPEHSGRVRGMPKGVTPTQLFKTPKPKRKSQLEVSTSEDSRINRMEEQLRQSDERNRRTEEKLNQLMEQFRSTHSNIGESSHASGSCVGRAASNVSPPPPPLAPYVEQEVVPPVLAPPPPPLAPHVQQVLVPPILAPPPPPPHVQPMITPPEPQVPPTMHEVFLLP
ncbi:uncharacterized protein LOC133821520 [Humulus lupulus]|uniref:uncharacterized protein LOC133821520 n=1 Tax=Humulus lupulus TaxID=3486 RepID=UPI002B403060|nr:uncharacterized protein LOC133821520 [Humulus lupulus]